MWSFESIASVPTAQWDRKVASGYSVLTIRLLLHSFLSWITSACQISAVLLYSYNEINMWLSSSFLYVVNSHLTWSHSLNVYPPPISSQLSTRSFKFKSAVLWSSLPHNLKSISNHSSCVKELKKLAWCPYFICTLCSHSYYPLGAMYVDYYVCMYVWFPLMCAFIWPNAKQHWIVVLSIQRMLSEYSSEYMKHISIRQVWHSYMRKRGRLL